LVELYESQHHRIGPSTPIEAIKFRLEQQGETARILEPILGCRSRVHEILNGKRPLTLRMIRNLHQKLAIPLESLVADAR
jgi:HTH-type transcriptional regulator/antitoxin HigA